MYGQFFLISSHSIQRVLSMSQLEALILSLSLEVQALTREELDTILTSLYGGPCPFPSYIPIFGFSKPTWLFATFFTYSFYHLHTAPKSVNHLLNLFKPFSQANNLTLARSSGYNHSPSWFIL